MAGNLVVIYDIYDKLFNNTIHKSINPLRPSDTIRRRKTKLYLVRVIGCWLFHAKPKLKRMMNCIWVYRNKNWWHSNQNNNFDSCKCNFNCRQQNTVQFHQTSIYQTSKSFQITINVKYITVVNNKYIFHLHNWDIYVWVPMSIILRHVSRGTTQSTNTKYMVHILQ